VLDLDVTVGAILSSARAGRFLSFGDVARANDAPWSRVRRGLGEHLKAACGLSLSRGGPMISSIVINRIHLATGAMEPETLAGFIAAARDLGLVVDDPEAFLRAQQAATFRWASGSGEG
jgi:5-methylcytosine-specific restriction protein B